MMTYEVKISPKKRKEIEEIKGLINEYKVTAIANLEKLPAFNLMKIKTQLRGKIVLKFTKKRLIKRAFDETQNENLINLKENLEGIPAIIFTNENPFTLFQLLKKSKTSAPAKTGDIAPRDIIIPVGPTEFTPGPLISELGSLGIKNGVENGKIVIKSEKLLVKGGEEINSKQANLITKLGMEPMEIGLNIILTYSNGEILERKILDIDIEKIFEELKRAVQYSIALAMNINYPARETITRLIIKGQREALSLERKYTKSSEIHSPQDKNNTKEKTLAGLKTNQEIQTEIESMPYDQTAITDEMVKKAQNILHDLTTKKMQGKTQ